MRSAGPVGRVSPSTNSASTAADAARGQGSICVTRPLPGELSRSPTHGNRWTQPPRRFGDAPANGLDELTGPEETAEPRQDSSRLQIREGPKCCDCFDEELGGVAEDVVEPAGDRDQANHKQRAAVESDPAALGVMATSMRMRECLSREAKPLRISPLERSDAGSCFEGREGPNVVRSATGSAEDEDIGETFVEPVCRADPSRFVLFPIKHAELWEMYKKAKASFWTVEEVDLSQVRASILRSVPYNN